MTLGRDLPGQTAERLRATLAPLPQKLRARALPRLARQVLALTSDEAPTDARLAVTLVELAAAATKQWTRLNQLRQQSRDGTDAPARAARARLLVELEHHAESRLPASPGPALINSRVFEALADHLDQALICMHGASQLVSELPAPHLGAGHLDTAYAATLLLNIAATDVSPLVSEAAIQAATQALLRLPSDERPGCLGTSGLDQLTTLASTASGPVFVRRRCIELYTAALGEGAAPALLKLLHSAEGKDSALVRVQAARSIVAALAPADAAANIATLLSDPSEHVRQVTATLLSQLPTADPTPLLTLATTDASPRVRGHALLAVAALAQTAPQHRPVLQAALAQADGQVAPLVQRAALEAAASVALLGTNDRLFEGAANLVQEAPLGIAERAALLLRRWELANSPQAAALLTEVAALPRTVRLGRQVELRQAPGAASLRRALVATAATDVAWGLTERDGTAFVQRGETPQLSLWRLAHEWRHPTPDKRLGVSHTAAPYLKGTTHTVPITLGAVTATRVPGERVSGEGGSWGGHLPRPSDMLAALRERRLYLLTVFGRLRIDAPHEFLARFRARLRLWLRFAALAALRTQELEDTSERRAGSYIETLRQLGFGFTWDETTVRLGSEAVSTMPPTVSRAYRRQGGGSPAGTGTPPAPLTLAAAPLLSLDGAVRYVLTPDGNAPWHVGLFVSVLLSVLLYCATRTKARFDVARGSLPLSIGGWGSRGKSSTERLKAAVLHAQHYDVVSKTTGGASMLLIAKRGQPAEELPLFRPYDKASIWEQEEVVQYAHATGAQAFLWECMAIGPEYADVLNRQWMQDEICTLTNTYPDHEETMGPSAEDVTRALGRFMPVRGHVVTSEEEMLPLLREAAEVNNSSLRHSPALQADLLPQDLLARFPYAEHPRNIALVLSLAEHLGLDRERALVDMADFVVPAPGALKTFSELELERRRVRFSNAMSANEHAGFASSWVRLGFDLATPERAPCELIIAVVNNRADRVPRSQAFAELLVRDAPCDRIVIIGKNTRDMRRRLLRQAKLLAASFELPPHAEAARGEAARLLAKYLRLPDLTSVLAAQLGAMLTVSGAEQRAGEPVLLSAELAQSPLEQLPARLSHLLSGDALTHAQKLVEHWQVVRDTLRDVAALSKKDRGAQAVAVLRATYLRLLQERILVIDNAAATGDELLDGVLGTFGPGLHAHLLGCQNMQGAGMTLLHTWQALERTLRQLDAIEATNSQDALDTLLAYPKHLAAEWAVVRQRLQTWADTRPDLEAARAALAAQLDEHVAQHGLPKTRGGRAGRAGAALLEAWLDPFASIVRRSRASRTLRASLRGRLSLAETATRLRRIDTEQRGGWLYEALGWLRRR